MAKAVDNTVLDAALDEIATSTRMTLCSAQPANYAGIAAVALANAVMAGGDYTNADGDTSGRKATVAAKAGESVDVTGTGSHVALDDGATLLYVTTCDSIAVTSGGTVDFPAWDIEIADPS
ncbi:MAG: hypothetical protein GY942_01130 [Aestuariibacter sp.]|nr:hypothetical protein [Aestuariibacter sp.]